MIPARAVLFDRDDTLIVDRPANRDPELVQPMPGAREALRRLRAHGVRVGVVTNQPVVDEGLVLWEELLLVHDRVEELVGRFDMWSVCPHRRDAGCGCRKPAPGLVHRSALGLGVQPRHCVVVGDIGSDMAAARAAGARGVLVPTARTPVKAIRDAPLVAMDLLDATDKVLSGSA
ncbi:HAD family hydrolase [Streptomyces sp. 549]|uniref:HAD family hydrolase n=1 Tax=Streptomyces sp. 549 TaxID=3049076 RepID=UPI0024C3CB07|nr:HAD family hydrolase [Streptomyces sp. 549]MDK1471949.1 HAD family hydrolase [Streptomyces sp. 549]